MAIVEIKFNYNYFVQVKRRLSSSGVATGHFDRVKQEGCAPRSESEVNIHLDGDTFPALVDDARDGIAGAATTVSIVDAAS